MLFRNKWGKKTKGSGSRLMDVVVVLVRIYTTINFTDEFRNVSVTLVSVTAVGVAGRAWWAWSTHA